MIIINLPYPSGRISPGIYTASNRNNCQKQKKRKYFWGVKQRQVNKADKFTAISEPIV
jgi:hypothetical protein